MPGKAPGRGSFDYIGSGSEDRLSMICKVGVQMIHNPCSLSNSGPFCGKAVVFFIYSLFY